MAVSESRAISAVAELFVCDSQKGVGRRLSKGDNRGGAITADG